MTVDTFFEKFEVFADAPDAVEKMRELVLHFAITGKLVATRPDDLPIDRTYNDLAKHAVSSSSNSPTNWRVVPLGHLGHWRGGGTPSKARADYWDGDIPWVSPKDMKAYSIGDAQDHVSLEAIDNCSAKILPPGSVLMVVRGMILVHTFPVAVTTREVVINQDMKALTPSHAPLAGYIVLTLRALEPQVLKAVERSSHGTCKLNSDVLESLAIPLPPLAEQKRIVAKVDELMGLCDRLEAQQKEREAKHAVLARAALARFAEAPTPENLQYLFHESFHIDPADLRKSILTLAVQGKLVSSELGTESANKVLKRIQNQIADAIASRRIRKARSAENPQATSLFQLPKSWEWTQLACIAAVEDNAMCDGPFGSKLKTEHYVAETGYAVLRLGNIGEGYFIKGKEGHITRTHFESLASNHIRPGDLLVAGLADPLIRCCEVPPDVGPAVNKSDCFRLRVHSEIDRSYVRHYLNSPVAKAFAAEENHGMTRERINLASAKALPIPLPPLAEQRRIVAKVESLMALVDRLEAQLAESRQLATRLLDAAVAELTAA